MLTARSARFATICAFVFASAAAVCHAPARGQLPQPRLTSLSRSGARAGEPVEVTLRGSDLEGAGQLWFDHPGLKATHVKDLTFRVTTLPDVPLGHYDVRAVGTYGVSNPRTFVVGDRPEWLETEPNNSPEKANAIAVNTVINGELNGAADVDCFAFDGRAGQRLFLDLQAERIDSRLDATIRLLAPAGTELDESRDVFGIDPFLDVILPSDGRYVIKVHDATYAGSPDHVYRLTVHDGPHLDAISPHAAVPGKTAKFTLIGRGLGRGALLDRRFDTEGRALERICATIPFLPDSQLGPGTGNAARMFVPAAGAAAHAGLEYSFVRSSTIGAAPTVSNRVFVALAAAPIVLEQEPNDDDSHAQSVTPPCDISGSFASRGDVDLFRFQGKKGEIWWIEAFAERIASSADPALVIQKVGTGGKASQDLASADDLPDAGTAPRFNTQTVDPALRWQVPDDGLYQVLVNDLYASQRGHPRLTYRLVIRREQPDFALVIVPNSPNSADAITIRAGGRASAYVAAIRKDGFAGAIRVEARELPAGVRARPVMIGPGQAIAPVAFEAAENARSTVGPVTLVGLAHFGDRKEDLGYVAGATPLGPNLIRPVSAGGMIWPPSAGNTAVAPARAFRGCVLAVRGEPAPLTLTASPAAFIVAQGQELKLALGVIRRAGFAEAVTASATDLPPNMPAASITIAKDAKSAILPIFVPKNVPQGSYTFVVRGTGAYPFSKDKSAKQKPNVTLTEPSNPITLAVRPAPISLAVNNNGGALKQGHSLEIDVSVTRQNGFLGAVSLTLDAPPNLKLAATRASLAESQSQAKLVISAARDCATGAAAQVFVRATATVRGEAIEVDEPVALTIGK